MTAKFSKVLALSFLLTAFSPPSGLAKQKPAPPFEPTLPWLTDFDEAIAAAKRMGKPILVEFR